MLAAIERGKTLDEAVDRLAGLPPRDAAFAHAIVMTTLRRRGQINDIISRYVNRPIPARPHLARALLQIGIAQLLFMGVAAHAAIHETVQAVGRQEAPYRGLLNAVLRRLDRERPTSEVANLPDWLMARWTTHYGAETTAQIAATLMHQPPLDLCFASVDVASAWSQNVAASTLEVHHRRLAEHGPVETLDGFANGQWWVQDFAAQIPARLFPSATPALDICAAPGGKTLQLASSGRHVTALDISANRLRRLQQNLDRCQRTAELVTADFLDWVPPRHWDNVLLDAPCSATGTLRRHPDIALHRREADIAYRASLQRQMISRAFAATAVGGTLVYCVCSLEPEEGEAIATFVEQEITDSLPFPIQPSELPPALAGAVNAAGQVRVLPHMVDGGLDGFFIARWRKR